MASFQTIWTLAVTAMLVELAMGATFTVGGGSNGWDPTTDLASWVRAQSFSFGDNLVFQYSTPHDVLEVSKADYDSCLASNPLQAHTGGNTVIPLSSPGKRYFICGVSGHCTQGMKLEVDTLATSAPPPASPVNPPPTSPPPPTSTPPSVPSPTLLPPSNSPSPSPKAPPSKSPSPSPKSAPSMSPSSSPSKSHSGSPTMSPTVPSTKSPLITPSGSPSSSLSPSGFTPLPSPSSSNGGHMQLKLVIGFGLGMMMLLAP